MFFQKKKRYSDYTIDLGKMQSKGIIPPQQEATSTTEPDSSSSQSTSVSAEGLGFLGALASSAQNNNPQNESYSPTSDYSSSPYSSSSSYNPSSDLPIDLRDRIRTISEKLYKILDRLDLIEHKIDRIERRTGIKEDI
ncbi:MAG: hypothetical protein V1660_00625 [archaeon]